MSRPTVAAPAAPSSSLRVPPARRRADIQGLRGLAVLLVVAFHAGIGPPGGFIAVDVFFVVSGFVIGGLLRTELADRGRIDLGRFYVRRIRRLLPALALVSVVTVVAGALLVSPIGPGQAALGRGVAAATGFVANVYLLTSVGGYFQPAAATHPFLHTWTLSVEEQFYLVFPVVLLLAWRGLRRPVLVVAVLLAVSLAADLVLTYGWLPTIPVHGLAALGQPDTALKVAFYSPLTRAWEFFAGALLALVRWRPGPAAARRLGGAGAAALVLGLTTIRSDLPFPGALALLPVAATTALLAAGTAGPVGSVVTRVLGWRPLVRLGDLSYSWYLWHWPAIVIVTASWPGVGWVALVAGFGALLPAYVGYRLVEEPVHRARVANSRRGTATVAIVCLVVPALAGAGLVVATGRGWGEPALAAIQAEIAVPHADLAAGCSSPQPLGSPTRPACVWPVDHPQGTVLLIGDSNAGHFTEPVVAAARSLGYAVEVATTGGCPILLRPAYLPGCREFAEGTVRAALTRPTPYAAVVVSNASVGYLNGPLIADFAADDPRPVAGADLRGRAIAGWATDLGRTVAALVPRGPVVVVGAVPQFAGLPQCRRPALLRGPAPGCGVIPAGATGAYRDDVIAAERTAVALAGGAYLDIGARLCPVGAGCRADLDGVPVYRDAAHLSVAGSMLFEPDFRSALAARLGVRSASR